jgi:hypothetical protein
MCNHERPHFAIQITVFNMQNAVFWDVSLCGFCKNQRFGGTSVLTRATRRNIPEDGSFHSHRCENVKSYLVFNILLFLLSPPATNMIQVNKLRSIRTFDSPCARAQRMADWLDGTAFFSLVCFCSGWILVEGIGILMTSQASDTCFVCTNISYDRNFEFSWNDAYVYIILYVLFVICGVDIWVVRL